MLVSILLLALIALAWLGVYRVRCAWSPFTKKGRRRAPYRLSTWWHGGQAENRDEY